MALGTVPPLERHLGSDTATEVPADEDPELVSQPLLGNEFVTEMARIWTII